MVFYTLYPWNVDHLPILYRTLYPWYIKPLPMVVWHIMGKGVTIQGVGVLYTMDRGFDMPWVGGSKYHGKGVQYIMDREFEWVGWSKYRVWGFDILLVRGSTYHA
jgi:hypothetical protein